MAADELQECSRSRITQSLSRLPCQFLNCHRRQVCLQHLLRDRIAMAAQIFLCGRISRLCGHRRFFRRSSRLAGLIVELPPMHEHRAAGQLPDRPEPGLRIFQHKGDLVLFRIDAKCPFLQRFLIVRQQKAASEFYDPCGCSGRKACIFCHGDQQILHLRRVADLLHLLYCGDRHALRRRRLFRRSSRHFLGRCRNCTLLLGCIRRIFLCGRLCIFRFRELLLCIFSRRRFRSCRLHTGLRHKSLIRLQTGQFSGCGKPCIYRRCPRRAVSILFGAAKLQIRERPELQDAVRLLMVLTQSTGIEPVEKRIGMRLCRIFHILQPVSHAFPALLKPGILQNLLPGALQQVCVRSAVFKYLGCLIHDAHRHILTAPRQMQRQLHRSRMDAFRLQRRQTHFQRRHFRVYIMKRIQHRLHVLMSGAVRPGECDRDLLRVWIFRYGKIDFSYCHRSSVPSKRSFCCSFILPRFACRKKSCRKDFLSVLPAAKLLFLHHPASGVSPPCVCVRISTIRPPRSS